MQSMNTINSVLVIAHNAWCMISQVIMTINKVMIKALSLLKSQD